MCDYSLHNVASRPAQVGDKLVSSGFRGAITRGFAGSDEPGVAVCLMPGTELAFDRAVEGITAGYSGTIKNFGHTVARFRQINVDNPLAHHDALEFPDGETILVTNLCEGQTATVLQLPSTGVAVHPAAEPAAERRETLTPSSA